MEGLTRDEKSDASESPNKSTVETIPVRKYFNLSFKMMALIGLRVNFENELPNGKVNITRTMRLYLAFIMGVVLVGPEVLFVINSLKRGDTFMAIQALTHLFSNLVCLIKGMRIANTIGEIQSILERIELNWISNRPHDKIKTEILRSADQTVTACGTVKSIAIFTVISFALLPVPQICGHFINGNSTNSSLQISQRILLYESPVEINNLFNYSLIYVYDMYLISMYATYWVCCDSFFAHITTHVALQFKVLEHDLVSLIDGRVFGQRLKGNFKTIVERHRELLSICDSIEHIFSPVLLGVVLFSSMAICVNVFELSEMIAQGKYIEASTNASLNMVTLFQIIFYCAFAERLTDATSTVGDALYNCDWTGKDQKYGCYFQMMIIQSQRPFRCTGMGFFTMDYIRLRLILNTAVSYYMMLRTLS